MTTEPRLRLQDVTVRYPGATAPSLVDLDLVVAAGERVGVSGPSGAGLTTLSLLAGGLLPRVVRAGVDGQAELVGIGATAATAADLAGRVGVVFSTPSNQLSGSKPTVRDELAFGLENLGVPRAAMDERIETVMERLGIGALAGREPSTLSGGEQQRLAIASIVIMGTELLVLDEPVAQLDPSGAAAVADLLGDLAADGTAVLAAERVTAFLATMDRMSWLRAAPGASSTDTPARPWRPVRRRPSATVELDHVSHHYAGGIEALRDASLTAEAGETVAIVGRNGSGKTTLVKHLIGLLQPSAGEVRIDGRSIAGRPIHAIAGTVGFVFQRPEDQLFERTVAREVGFGPRMLGFDAGLVERLVDDALGATGLTGQRATNPYDLGLAGRRLVALASVLAMDPAIVVLDEPTAGHDPAGVARVADLVRALAGDGRTVIAITHDLAFAAEAFERVVVMRDGSIVDDGPPGRVLGAGNEALLASTGLA